MSKNMEKHSASLKENNSLWEELLGPLACEPEHDF